MAHNLLQALIHWKAVLPEDFVIETVDWDHVSKVAAFCQTFSYGIKCLLVVDSESGGVTISGEEWDLITVAATTWMASLLDEVLVNLPSDFTHLSSVSFKRSIL